MSVIAIYGIKNCDTMKKAFVWLDEQGVDFIFHDYKKQGVDEVVLRVAIAQHGWESVLNKRGTTWRKLSEEVKNEMDSDLAVETALENPSIIKRPVLVRGDDILLGFDGDAYGKLVF